MKAKNKKLRDKLIAAYRAAQTDEERAEIEQSARALGVTMEALLGRKNHGSR